MPRYYFHMCHEDGRIPDDDGLELDDAEAARIEAFASARELALQSARDGQPLDIERIEIEDVEGKPLMTVPVRGAIVG